MKIATPKLFFAAAALLATLSGPVLADNANTTIQEGRINTNDTYQKGHVNDNATYQQGNRINLKLIRIIKNLSY